jgi:branched-subunit amino acid ABC-type transport system permease component
MNEILVTLGFGLVTAAILSLSAVAFTLEYSVTNVANLSHGEILTVGAYAAYLVHRATGSAILAALAAAGAGAVLAWAVHATVVDRFLRRGINTMAIFIATLGVSFLVQNALVILFGAANVAYTIPQGAPRHVGPFLWTGTELEILASALGITAALYVIIKHTKFGKSLRAVSQSRDLARASGIRAHRVAAATWVNPYFGFGFFLITLTAAVAGGLGKPFSTLVGAIIVGIVLEFAGSYASASYNLAFAFAILALVVLFRPRGLFNNARRSVFE